MCYSYTLKLKLKNLQMFYYSFQPWNSRNPEYLKPTTIGKPKVYEKNPINSLVRKKRIC